MTENEELKSFIADLSAYSCFKNKNRIKVFERDEGDYIILIDDTIWNSYRTFEETKEILRTLFHGIRLGKGLI